MEQSIVWGREPCLIRSSWTLGSIFLNGKTGTKSLIISIYGKKFASLGELQKQWGTESRTKAEVVAAAAGQLGEGEEAGNIRRKGQRDGASWEQFTRLAGTYRASSAPPFLKENAIAISVNTRANKTLHLLEAGAGIWQSLRCWQNWTGKQSAAALAVTSSQNSSCGEL